MLPYSVILSFVVISRSIELLIEEFAIHYGIPPHFTTDIFAVCAGLNCKIPVNEGSMGYPLLHKVLFRSPNRR